MKDPCKIIGHNLRILRDALGITQMEAARRIDISVSGYREIERGNANPTLRTVELIADGMGVPPLALIKEPLDSDKVQFIQAVILLTRAISPSIGQSAKRIFRYDGKPHQNFSRRGGGKGALLPALRKP